MAGGYVSVEFYGPCCDIGIEGRGAECVWTSNGSQWTKVSQAGDCLSGCGCPTPTTSPSEASNAVTYCRLPVPSYWLPSETGRIQFTLKCENPGLDAEPNPARWIAEGTMRGVEIEDPADFTKPFGNMYKVRIAVNAIDFNTISVSGVMWWLDHTKTWKGYTSGLNATLTEIPTSYMPPFRQRNFRSDFIPVTTALGGGQGDPVSYVRLTVVMIPIRAGCGTLDNSVPKCGMWDTVGWHSCFRAHIEGNQTGALDGYFPKVGQLYQLGLDGSPCGGGSNPNFEKYCACDVINNGATANSHTCENNADPSFLQSYAVIGAAGETDPYSRQQIQISNSYGGICVKNVNNGPITIGYLNSTNVWEVAVPTTVRSSSPHIFKAIFSEVTVWLYSMRFPNPDILPEQCPTTVTGYDCGGSCQYIYSELAEAWVLQPGNCGEWSGCSCMPPDPMYIVPGGYMLVPCQYS